MTWLRQRSPLQIVLLALAWPVFLAAAAVIAFVWFTRDNIYVVGLSVSVWSIALLIVFGPSVLLSAIWLLERRRRGPAT